MSSASATQVDRRSIFSAASVETRPIGFIELENDDHIDRVGCAEFGDGRMWTAKRSKTVRGFLHARAQGAVYSWVRTQKPISVASKLSRRSQPMRS